MAAVKICDFLKLLYEDSFCLTVQLTREQDNFTVDEGWIAGAFFLGLCIGVGLVAILTKPFLIAWRKKKHQDEEKLLGYTQKAEIIIKSDKTEKEIKNSTKSKKTFERLRFWRKKHKSDKRKDVIDEDDLDPAFLRGMVDIMQQTSSIGSDLEMAEQDMSTIISNERSQEEEKDMLLLRILALLLKKKAKKRLITQNFYLGFLKKTENEVKELKKNIEREKEEAEETIRNNPKLSKDTQTQETEMLKLHSSFNDKQKKLMKDNVNKIREELLLSSGMSEADVDDVLEKLVSNLAIVEEKIGLEQARQKRALEQRLAKRKRDTEFKQIEDKEMQNDIETRVQLLKNLLNKAFRNGGKSDNQVEQIVTNYNKDLEAVHKKYEKDYEEKVKEKNDSLKRNRLVAFHKLIKKQEKEKASFLQNADKTTNTVETIKQYHDLMVKHHMDQEALGTELDQIEIQEIARIKHNVLSEEKKALDQESKNFDEKLENITHLNVSEVEKIIKIHRAQMSEYEAKRQRDKQAIMARLQEILQQRLSVADNAEGVDLKEQELLKEQQTATVAKVLSMNMDLTDEDKNRILKEHEHNMKAISNQLLASKLRQQKSLEIKLNLRKARLLELKQNQEDQKLSKQKDKADIESKLADDIEKEELSFEEDKKKAIAELRQNLAKETEEALKLYEEELTLLIGKLQVGQARRKAILENQEQTHKKLQDDWDKQTAAGVSMPPSMVDQIIQQHYKQVNYLNEQLQQRRLRQEKSILDKLNIKKQKMEEEIETQLEEEAQEEYKVKVKKGAGFATRALMQIFLEQRHTKAMQELETDMMAELEKTKAELNAELESQLKKDLEVQHKDFLNQLAEISKMSRTDVQDAFSGSTIGKRSQSTAEQLASNLREGINKGSKGVSEGKQPSINLGYSRDSDYVKPAKSLQKPKQVYNSDEESDDMSEGSLGF